MSIRSFIPVLNFVPLALIALLGAGTALQVGCAAKIADDGTSEDRSTAGGAHAGYGHGGYGGYGDDNGYGDYGSP